MTPFPWTEVMRAGLGQLRLPPDQFWLMTPRELAAALSALEPFGAISPPARTQFNELIKKFPDKATTHGQ